MDLGEARVRHCRAAFVGPPDRSAVRTLGICRKIENVAVPTRTENDSVRDMRFNFSGYEIANDNPAGLSTDHDDIQHLGAGIHSDLAGRNLAFKRLVSAKEQLLARLAAGIKCS